VQGNRADDRRRTHVHSADGIHRKIFDLREDRLGNRGRSLGVHRGEFPVDVIG
jgi:hypothetical protein